MSSDLLKQPGGHVPQIGLHLVNRFMPGHAAS